MSRIADNVIEDLFRFNDRCYECGSTYHIQIHHRIFISEGELFLKQFLSERFKEYKESFGVELDYWQLDDIQNLVVLCQKCHEADYVGVHGGNQELNYRLKHSFTDSRWGLNIKFKKNENNRC